MNVHFQKVFETCAARGFQDCTDMQKADMDQWHRADYRAGQMMLSIEAQSLALKEAAAGDANRQAANQKDAGQKKTLWQKITAFFSGAASPCAVIGPRRMNYARIIPMVDYTAKVVGRILG